MSQDSGIALLLTEDFDGRASAPAPDIEVLLASARAEARAEVTVALDTRAVAAQEALASACAALAANLTPAFAALDEVVAETAQSLARTMIAAIGVALPAWSETLAPHATAGIVATLSRALGATGSPRLRVPTTDAPALRSLLPACIAIETDPAMMPGALQLAWSDGQAIRDPAAIWREVEAILTPTMRPPGRATE